MVKYLEKLLPLLVPSRAPRGLGPAVRHRAKPSFHPGSEGRSGNIAGCHWMSKAHMKITKGRKSGTWKQLGCDLFERKHMIPKTSEENILRTKHQHPSGWLVPVGLI